MRRRLPFATGVFEAVLQHHRQLTARIDVADEANASQLDVRAEESTTKDRHRPLFARMTDLHETPTGTQGAIGAELLPDQRLRGANIVPLPCPRLVLLDPVERLLHLEADGDGHRRLVVTGVHAYDERTRRELFEGLREAIELDAEDAEDVEIGSDLLLVEIKALRMVAEILCTQAIRGTLLEPRRAVEKRLERLIASGGYLHDNSLPLPGLVPPHVLG